MIHCFNRRDKSKLFKIQRVKYADIILRSPLNTLGQEGTGSLEEVNYSHPPQYSLDTQLYEYT